MCGQIKNDEGEDEEGEKKKKKKKKNQQPRVNGEKGIEKERQQQQLIALLPSLFLFLFIENFKEGQI